MQRFNLYAIKMLGIIFSGLGGIYSIKVFLSKGDEATSIYIGIITWTAFLPLLQLGYSKPIYAYIRFNKLKTIDKNLEIFGTLFFIQQLFSVFLSGLIVIALCQINGIPMANIVPFTIGYIALISCGYSRDYHYANDNEVQYEVMELFRKISVLILFLGINFGLDINICGYVMLLIAIISTALFGGNISIFSGGLQRKIDFIKLFRQSAFHYFIFSLVETLMYYIPLIYSTIIKDGESLIYFGIWYKVFFLVLIGSRVLTDTQINSVIKFYADKLLKNAIVSINKIFFYGVTIFLVSITAILVYWNKFLLFIHAPISILEDNLFVYSIIIWAIGNIIQHPFGTFLTSITNKFDRSAQLSKLGLLINTSLFIAAHLYTKNNSIIMIVCGVGYIINSLLYFKIASDALKSSENINV